MRIAILLAALAASAAHAVSPDLKVSTDDLNEAGEQFIEVQANKASGWPFQFLGEYSYGITDAWQVAAKVPFAREDGVHSLGANVEVRYLGEHDPEKGGYWGVNLTAGRGRGRSPAGIRATSAPSSCSSPGTTWSATS